MTGSSASGASRRLLPVQAFALLAVLGLWTWTLLIPNPVPEVVSVQLTDATRFLAAKSLHAVAYAVLTVLAVTLPVPRHWRWFFVGLLALHGVATETGQTFVHNRTGSARDVLLDWLGIGLGLVFVFVASGGRKPSEQA